MMPALQCNCMIAVVVPTYLRPGPLVDCICSVVEGSSRPDVKFTVSAELE